MRLFRCLSSQRRGALLRCRALTSTLHRSSPNEPTLGGLRKQQHSQKDWQSKKLKVKTTEVFQQRSVDIVRSTSGGSASESFMAHPITDVVCVPRERRFLSPRSVLVCGRRIQPVSMLLSLYLILVHWVVVFQSSHGILQRRKPLVVLTGFFNLCNNHTDYVIANRKWWSNRWNSNSFFSAIGAKNGFELVNQRLFHNWRNIRSRWEQVVGTRTPHKVVNICDCMCFSCRWAHQVVLVEVWKTRSLVQSRGVVAVWLVVLRSSFPRSTRIVFLICPRVVLSRNSNWLVGVIKFRILPKWLIWLKFELKSHC